MAGLYPERTPMLCLGLAAPRFLALSLDTGDRSAFDDEDEFGEAIDCLEAYTQLRPQHFDRKEVNAQLWALTKGVGGAA